MLKKKSSSSRFRRLAVLFLVGLGVHNAIANQVQSQNQNPNLKEFQNPDFPGSEFPSPSYHRLKFGDRRGVQYPMETSGIERAKRSALQNLKSLLDRSSSLSRILTGIHLQTGLQNGTIKIDSAIGELLNFGSQTTSDVGGFKKDLVDALKTGVEKAKGDMKASMEQEKLMKDLEQMRRDSESVKNLEMKDGDEEVAGYFTSLADFLTKFDFNGMKNIGDAITAIKTNLMSISEFYDPASTDDADTKNGKTWKAFTLFFHTVAGYNLIKDDIKNLNTQVRGFTSLETFPTIFKTYSTVLNLLDRHSTLSKLSQDIPDNIGHLSTLISTSKSSDPEFQKILQLIRSRSFPLETPRASSPGFIFGAQDLSKLLKDIQDPWFEKMIGDGKVQKLVNALKPLLSIQTRVSEMDGKFLVFNKDSGVNGIRNLQMELMKMDVSKTEADNIVQALKSDNPKTSDYEAESKVIKAIRDLSSAITSVKKWAEHLVGTEFTQAIQEFNATLIFSDRGNADKSKQEIPTVMAKLKELKSIEKFQAAIGKAQALLNKATGDGMKTTAGSIKKDPLEKFKDHKVVKNEMTFLGNLQNQKQGLEKLINANQVVQKVLALDSGELTTLATLSNAISGASKDLQLAQLQTLTSDWKKEKESDSEILLMMSGLPELSKTIGEAVRGLQKMYDFKDSKMDSELESLKVSVEEALGKLVDPQKTDIQKKWGKGLDKEIGSVKTWIQNLEGLEAKITVTTAKNISEVGSSFGVLQNVGDVVTPGVSKIEVLDLITPLLQKDPILQDKLRKARSDIEAMMHLDLHFSKFYGSFNAAPKSFNGLDLEFVKFSNPKYPNGPVLETSTLLAMLSTTVDAGIVFGLKILEVWIIGGSIVLFVIGVPLSCYFIPGCLWHRRRTIKALSMKEDRKEELEQLMQKAATDTVAGYVPPNPAPAAPPAPPALAAPVAPVQNANRDVEQGVVPPAVPKKAEPKSAKKSAKKKSEKKTPAELNKQEGDPAPPPKANSLLQRLGLKRTEDSARTARLPDNKLHMLEGHQNDLVPQAVVTWFKSLEALSLWAFAKKHADEMRYVVIRFKEIVEENVDKAAMALPKKKWRNVPLNPYAAVVCIDPDGTSFRIHANDLVSASGARFTATQGPMDAVEVEILKKGKEKKVKEATVQDFWNMVYAKESKRLLMLCNVMEPRVFDEETHGEAIHKASNRGKNPKAKPKKDEKKPSQKCGRYFHETLGESVVCGRYRIVTVNLEKAFKGNMEVRKLKVIDTKGKAETRYVVHYHVITWPDGACPYFDPNTLNDMVNKVTEVADYSFKNPDSEEGNGGGGDGAELQLDKTQEETVGGSTVEPERASTGLDADDTATAIPLARTSPIHMNPIIVHCSSGIGRTMVFIGTELIAAEVIAGNMTDITSGIIHLRNFRWRAIQSIRQSMFLEATITHRLQKIYNVSETVDRRISGWTDEIIYKPHKALGKNYMKEFFHGTVAVHDPNKNDLAF